jgi:hypothetical protein
MAERHDVSKLLAEIDRGGVAMDKVIGYRTAHTAALRAVVELCAEHMIEAVGGGLTNADTIPPTKILDVIARELGG